MNARFLIDTNAALDLFGKKLSPSAVHFLDEIALRNAAFISVINRIELLSNPQTFAETRWLEDFIEKSNVIPLSEDVVLQSIELRQKHKLKLADSIVAATAVVFGLTLLTRDRRGFHLVDGLIVVDPHEL